MNKKYFIFLIVCGMMIVKTGTSFALLNLQYSLSGPYGCARVGDVDNDGKNELIVGTYDAGGNCQIQIYQWTGSTYTLIWSKSFLGYACHGFAADVDTDGQNELIVSVDYGDTGGWVKIFEYTGSNNWTEVWTGQFNTIRNNREVAVGDCDNDGKNEMVIGVSWYGRIGYIYEHSGGNTYTKSWETSGYDWDSVTIGDVDNDGLNEFVAGLGLWSGSTCPLRIYKYSGGTYNIIWEYTLNNFTEAVIGDVDNDGQNEILFAKMEGAYGLGIIKNISGSYTLTWNNSVNYCFKPRIGDILNKGTNQFVFLNNNTVYLYEYSAGNYNIIWSTPLGGDSANWYAEELFIGDANNDGKNDLIVSHKDVGVKIYSSVSWTAPKGKIVFSSNRDGNWEIYCMDEDGTNLIRLTNSPDTDDVCPQWSPDGTQIAFVRVRNNKGDIFIMNSDGTNVRQITNTGNILWLKIAWSLDGNWIYHNYWLSTGRGDIRRTKVDGSTTQFFLDPTGETYSVEVSPDGAYLLYCRQDGSWSPTLEIYRTPIATPGSPITKVFNDPDSSYDDFAVYSPDGSKIVWHHVAQSGGYDFRYTEIYIMNSDGTNVQRLTNNYPYEDIEPAWMNNTTIIFSSNRDGDHEIYRMNIDGTNVVQLTNNNWDDRQPHYFGGTSVQQNGFVSGKVTKSDGITPISGALVEVWQKGAKIADTATLTDGTYSLSVATGTYKVRAYAIDYAFMTTTGVVVTAGQTATVNFSLASLEGWNPNAKIALLVRNTASLDTEEQAAYSTATARGFNVTLVDPTQILNNPGILSTFDAFWAHTGSEPTGYNNTTIINALRTEISKDKKMLVSWYGKYLVQYLGIATVRYTGWWPAVSDEDYFVDCYVSNPLMVGLSAWEPPTGPPDNDNQSIWRVNPGTRYRVWIDTMTLPGTFVKIWTSYGWTGQTPNTELGSEYGITPTSERNIYIINFPVNQMKLGNGEIIEFVTLGWNGELTSTNGTIKPAGRKMFENALKYITIPRIITIGNISGKVTKSDGVSPIPGALVEVLQAGVVKYSATTDADGNYSITVATGTYDIRASASGFVTQTKTNQAVYAGQTTIVNFVLNIEVIDINTIMSDAKLVMKFETNAEVDVDRIVADVSFNATRQGEFAVWERGLNDVLPQLPGFTYWDVFPTSLKLRFAVNSQGEFYVGTVGSNIDSEHLSVLTDGMWNFPVVDYDILYTGPNERQNMLCYGFKEEWLKKIKLKGYAKGGPENFQEIMNLSYISLQNRFVKPIYIVFSAVCHDHVGDSEWGLKVRPRWSPATTVGGSKTLERNFEIYYSGLNGSFVSLRTDVDNGNSSEIYFDDVLILNQINWGPKIKRISGLTPNKVYIKNTSVWSGQIGVFRGAFIAESITFNNIWEKENGVLNPINSFDKNPPPDVFKINVGINESGVAGRITGAVVDFYGNPIKNAKVEFIQGGTIKGRTVTNINGTYSAILVDGVYDVKVVAESYYSAYSAAVEIKGNLITYKDFTLSPIPGIVISTTTWLSDDGAGTITDKWIQKGAPLPFYDSGVGNPAPSLKLNGDGAYHSGVLSKFTLDRERGDIVIECDFRGDTTLRPGGFGWGRYSGPDTAGWFPLPYGIVLSGSGVGYKREYYLGGELFLEEGYTPGNFEKYKIVINRTGGAKFYVNDVLKLDTDMDTATNNYAVVIWSHNPPYWADNIKVTQYLINISTFTGTIIGKVTKSDGETPLANAIVQVISGTTIIASTVTNTAGNYLIEVTPGTYDVKVVLAGYISQTTPRVIVEAGKAVSVNFALNETTTAGKPDLIIESLKPSTTEATKDQIITVTIVIKNQGDVAAGSFFLDFYKNLTQPPALTQVGDKYWQVSSLGALATSTFTYTFVFPGGEINMYAQIDTDGDVAEANETNNTYGPIKVKEPVASGSLTGKIYSKADGKIISGASIVAKQEGITKGSTLSKLDGSYNLSLAAGSYTIEVSAAGYASTSTVVSIDAGKTTFKTFYLDLPTTIEGVIYGRVTKTDGVTAIPNAKVELYRGETKLKETYTTYLGDYRIITTSGSYTLKVTATGYRTSQKDVTVPQAQSIEVNFKLTFIIVPPEPVADLTATALGNLTVALDWTPSVTPEVAKYHIYYTQATADIGILTTELFSAPKDIVDNTVNHWVSPYLTRGEKYYFSVRPVALIEGQEVENLDTNNVVSVVVVEQLYGVKARIKIPQTGKKITGNMVLVMAEPYLNPTAVKEIKFEYKASHEDTWQTIPPATTRHPNPDSSWPYFIHWDVSELEDGNYDIRAVAYDVLGGWDTQPDFITISVNKVDKDIEEKVVDGRHQRKEKIDNRKNNKVHSAGIEEDDITEVVISTGALKSTTDYVKIVTNPPIIQGPLALLAQTIKVRDVSLESGQKELLAEAGISIPYQDDDNDGIEDTTKTKAEELEVWSYDEEKGKWKKEEKVEVDKTNKKVKVKTKHFSTFAVVSFVASSDLRNVRVYPSPCKVEEGHDRITFAGLTGKNVTIKIFNIAAELVYKKEGIMTSTYDWFLKNDKDEPVASGVYIYLISDEAGNKVSGKFSIIR